MKCPNCDRPVEYQNRQVGVDENGEPIFRKYAICRDCKKQWNLEKQPEKTRQEETSKQQCKARQQNQANQSQQQQYGNIPPEKVRAKREQAVKSNYEYMLSLDPERHKSRTVVQKHPVYDKPKYYTLRMVFAAISIVVFALFTYRGFLTGIENISNGSNSNSGTIYIVFSLCMLVSSLLLIIMQRKQTILSVILPLIFYILGFVYACFSMKAEPFLLYGAVLSFVCIISFLGMTITYRRQKRMEDEE
jgi:tryptophan-rich sensory protein